MKKITELTNVEAREYFFENESYVNFDLPDYFNFEILLEKLSNKIGVDQVEFQYINDAKKETCVNHSMISNKDGRYSWRKFEIVHPVLYVSLVNLITQKDNWKIIKKSLAQSSKKIDCLSVPIIPAGDQSHKAEQISNWYEQVEGRSVQLGLDFCNLYQTDITDCYGSVYTHSLSWALHTKYVAKKRRDSQDKNGNRLLGSHIDAHLQAMACGQTNGIPQGSNLMNLLAEILLCYADNELAEKLKLKKINQYQILRFRDDYRIFTNSEKDGDAILICLNEIMADLSLRLNPSKTSVSQNVTRDSLKSDKIHAIKYPKATPKKIYFDSVRKELFYIESFGSSFSNSGTVQKRLKKLHKSMIQSKYKFEYFGALELSSILVQIALNNPRVFPYMAANLSRIISDLRMADKKKILKKVVNRFKDYPNSGYFDLWMQRLVIKIDRDTKFDEKLCKIASDPKEKLFEVKWLKNEWKTVLNNTKIIDEKKLADMDLILSQSEVDLFYQES